MATPDSEPAGAKKSIHTQKGAHTHRLALLTVIDTAGWPSRLFRAGNSWRDDERLVVFAKYKTTLDYLRSSPRVDVDAGDGMNRDLLAVSFGRVYSLGVGKSQAGLVCRGITTSSGI